MPFRCRFLFIFIPLSMIFFAGCALQDAPSEAYGQISDGEANLLVESAKVLPKVLLRIERGKEAVGRFEVEVAREEMDRRRGLMFRQQLTENAGMLFIFERQAQLSFWMKNTLIPLDMIFIDQNHKIVHVVQAAMPCKTDPCEGFSSSKPAQYVLEINAGLSQKLGIIDGAEVRW